MTAHPDSARVEEILVEYLGVSSDPPVVVSASISTIRAAIDRALAEQREFLMETVTIDRPRDDEWVSVDERLPSSAPGKIVEVLAANAGARSDGRASYEVADFWIDPEAPNCSPWICSLSCVTHWKPINGIPPRADFLSRQEAKT